MFLSERDSLMENIFIKPGTKIKLSFSVTRIDKAKEQYVQRFK